MPGVALNEAVSPANPRLFFAYQALGLLTDVAELKFSVRDVEHDATRVIETDVDLTGDRLGYGRYAPTFTPTGADGWCVGTHEILWKYRLTLAGTQYQCRQHFEVLDPTFFAGGASYIGYADTFILKNTATFSALDTWQLHNLIDSASRQIESLTGRFFEPRYLEMELSGDGTQRQLLSHPIIGLDSASEVGVGPGNSLFEIDRTGLRIYNRHLGGLLDPDDRSNPKIEFASDPPFGAVFAGTFYKGNLNIALHGVFGYTDPDGSPTGCVPKILTRAIGIFAARENLDPFGQDMSTSQPGRIKSAKTRDQAITFATGEGATGAATIGAITGDRSIDDFLIGLMRPPEARFV